MGPEGVRISEMFGLLCRAHQIIYEYH